MEHTGLVRGHHTFDKECTVCRLQAENKKLREALEKIVSYRKWLKMSGGMDIHKIAEQALKG
ncbi:hypothetical protein LCGC14_0580850 [marine sediment metagenome]|uniref:Uncharacterized protein n=1 Tax=marine sediment metagenome TaxID=412755 RepID=A0A0F9UPS8_9ZZZZ